MSRLMLKMDLQQVSVNLPMAYGWTNFWSPVYACK